MIEEKNIEEMAKKMAEAIKAELNIDEQMKSLKDEIVASQKTNVMKVFVSKDVEKEVDSLTAEEKTVAFAQALFTGNEATLKVLSEGGASGADGGYTVPQDFYATLLQAIELTAVMRPKVTVVPMKSNVLTLSMIDNGPEVYWTGEGVKKTTTTADFSQPTITAYKLASIIYLTDELIEDSAFGLVNVLVARFAQKMAQAEDKAIIQGTGTGQPTGLFTASTVATRNCSGNLDFDDIIDLIYDLPMQFRANAVFMVNPANVKELRKSKDTTGQYLWQSPVSAGQPATIQGYPVIENYWVPEAQILFGDLKEAYWLGDRQKMTVKVSNDTETTFTEDKTAIRVVERIGGTVVFPNAVRKLVLIP